MSGLDKNKSGLLGRMLAWFSRPASVGDSVVLRQTRRPWRRRRRAIVIGMAVIAFLCLTPVMVAAYLFNRLSEGPIALDWMRKPLASGISARIGPAYTVEVGPIVLEDSDHGPRFAISGLKLSDENGRSILDAPKAEAAINPLPLIFGRISPRRLEIQDVELRLSVLPDGSVSISAGSEPVIIAEQNSALAAPSDLAPSAAAPPAPDVIAQLGSVLRAVLDSATRANTPVGALKRLGISRGRLVFEDRTARSVTVFDDLVLDLDRMEDSAHLFVSAQGPEGRWRIEASVNGKPSEARSLDVSIANLTLDQILLVAGMRDPGFEMSMPLSARLNLAMAADGHVSGAGGQFAAGKGFMFFADRDFEPVQVDRIEGSFVWRADTRRFEIDRTLLHMADTQFSVAGALIPPSAGEPLWRIEARALERGLFGPERQGQKPIIVDRASLAARINAQERRLVVDRFEMVGPELALAASADLQLTERGPHLRMNLSSGRTPVQNIMRLWPSFVSPTTRNWFQRSLNSGTVEDLTLWLDFDPETMNAMDVHAPPDASMRLAFRLSNTSLLAMPGVPPLSGIAGSGVLTGRTAYFSATRGLMQVTPTHRLVLAEGSFAAPDLDAHPTPATVTLRMNGPLDAVADLFDREALKPFAEMPIDSTNVKGLIDGRLVIGMTLGNETKAEDVRISASASISNFTVDKLVGSEKLEAGTLTLTASRGTLNAVGQGRLFGAPATIELRKKSADQPTEATLGMQLDDAARNKLGLNFGSALTGQIGARLTAVLGQKDKPRAQVEIDFTRAAIDNLLPGYTKQAGRPAKASFILVNDPDGPDLEQFVFDGGGGAIARGTIELDASGGLERARLTQVRLSPGDDIRIEAEQKDVLRLVVSGRAVDARPFLKLLTTGAPSGSRGPATPPKDFDLELKAATVTGHNGKSASGVEMRLGRRNGQIRQFQLSGRFGRESVAGSIARANNGDAPQVAITTNDGGALLSFFDFYRRMEGGKLTFVASVEDGMIDGTVNVRDFIVRNEPALRRLVTEGVAARDRSGQMRIDTTAAAFTRLQVSFTRAQGRIDLRDGIINGPEAGATIEGSLDTLNDRVNMTGTFVPAYGLNNMFAKIPVVGFFLGGGSNEGLFGVNFRISGPATAPVLTINPLSALAPGFLRKIFGAGEIGTSQMPQPPAPVPQEQPSASNGTTTMQYAPARRIGPFR